MVNKIVVILLCLAGVIRVPAQVNALFVNDNSTEEESTEMVFGIIEQYLGELAYFNAVDSARSPDYDEMAAYNLVIWYCGIDEGNLYLWNGKYEDNSHLMEYMDKGGSFWLMGRDFLNARFIKPPRNYSEGTFLHDYLGITRWSSESYTSDNGLGCRVMLEDDSCPVGNSLDSLNWMDATESMVDGCELAEGGSRYYYFGPGAYTLYGEPTAFYFKRQQTGNMTFAFDPARMDSKGNASTLISDVLQYYEGVLDVSLFDFDKHTLSVYPNPAIDHIMVEVPLEGAFTLKLYDQEGKLVTIRTGKSGAADTRLSIPVSGLSPGLYLLTLTGGRSAMSARVLVASNP